MGVAFMLYAICWIIEGSYGWRSEGNEGYL